MNLDPVSCSFTRIALVDEFHNIYTALKTSSGVIGVSSDISHVEDQSLPSADSISVTKISQQVPSRPEW